MLREPGIRILRSAGFACAAGVATTVVFRLLAWVGADVHAAGSPGGQRRFLYENLPKGEEFGWLIGSLLFVALMLTPLPASYRTVASLARAALVALAAALPLHFLCEAMTGTGSGLVWLFVALPLFGAMVLRDGQRGARDAPAAPPFRRG